MQPGHRWADSARQERRGRLEGNPRNYFIRTLAGRPVSPLAGVSPQGSLLLGAGAGADQGSGLVFPPEGGEVEVAAPKTSGDPREGGTPTPPMPPQGSGMVELEMMGPIPPQGSLAAPPEEPFSARGDQGSLLAAVLWGGFGPVVVRAGAPKLRSTRSDRALPGFFSSG